VKYCPLDDSGAVKNYLIVAGTECKSSCSTDYVDATVVEPKHAIACIVAGSCNFFDSTSTNCLAACPVGFSIIIYNYFA